ncbi:PBP1A family penicillin-binding protein [Myxococcota bacterium]|nr:PBP1A family penicillin-binding protein [Myxococcota bacterium]
MRWLLTRLLLLLILATAAAAAGAWAWSGVLDARIVDRIERGRALDEPSVVWGAPVVVRKGEYLSISRAREALTRAGWTEAREVDGDRRFHVSRNALLLDPPGDPRLEVRLVQDRVTSIRDAKGVERPEYALPAEEIAPLVGEDRTRRTPVPLAEIPQVVQDAVLAIEDSRFHQHPGVDLRSLVRAAWADLRAREFVQGGSTITQQLAKNLFLAPEKKLLRKANELLIARALERRYGKDRILELYLNQIYLGQRGGFAIYGVEQGARAYFGKTLRQLDLAEAATLAGAIQAPNRWAPWKHPEDARRRRDQVLDRMVTTGLVPRERAETAKATALHVKKGEAVLARRAPWFLERVRDLLEERFPGPALAREGYRVETTLDLTFQIAAEAAVKDGLAALEAGYPSLARKGRLEAGLVSLDPRTGEVRAWVGGRDYGASQFDRVHQALRQPGSAFKPLVLAAALEADPEGITGAATFSDDPLTVEAPGSAPWSPGNYDGTHRGRVTLMEATWDSRNLPFVRLGQRIGLPAVAATARDMGIRSPVKPVPSVVLGASDTSPLDLAVAYATLANGGARVSPSWVRAVRDPGGEAQMTVDRIAPKRVLRPDTAHLVTDLLRGVVLRGTGRASSSAVKVPFVGKTGTTDRARDAWFAGYSADLVTVVWVGYDGEEVVGLTGGQAALPLWSRYMASIGKYLSGQDFSPPEGVVAVPVCPRSGRIAHPGCPLTVQAAFRAGTDPPESCPVHGLDGQVLGEVPPWPPEDAAAAAVAIDGSPIPATAPPGDGAAPPSAGEDHPRDPLGALIARRKAEREARRRAQEGEGAEAEGR